MDWVPIFQILGMILLGFIIWETICWIDNNKELSLIFRKDQKTMADKKQVLVANTNEARTLLNAMNEIFDRIGFVTVADLNELTSQGTHYRDTKYGWVSTPKANLRQSELGCMMEFPAPVSIGLGNLPQSQVRIEIPETLHRPPMLILPKYCPDFPESADEGDVIEVNNQVYVWGGSKWVLLGIGVTKKED